MVIVTSSPHPQLFIRLRQYWLNCSLYHIDDDAVSSQDHDVNQQQDGKKYYLFLIEACEALDDKERDTTKSQGLINRTRSVIGWQSWEIWRKKRAHQCSSEGSKSKKVHCLCCWYDVYMMPAVMHLLASKVPLSIFSIVLKFFERRAMLIW